MNSGDLTLLLDRLLAQTGEHEWLEFKHNDDPHTIGEYISALANAAALDGEPCGFMVWGVEDETRRVLGTRFKPGSAKIGAQLLRFFPQNTKFNQPVTAHAGVGRTARAVFLTEIGDNLPCKNIP